MSTSSFPFDLLASGQTNVLGVTVDLGYGITLRARRTKACYDIHRGCLHGSHQSGTRNCNSYLALEVEGEIG